MGAWVHAITPGDHYSPSTGSAIPTVVDGIAGAAAGRGPAQYVIVADGTYDDRYLSAAPVSYRQGPHVGRLGRISDITIGRVTTFRPTARRELRPLLQCQRAWGHSTVLAHNLVGLVPLVDTQMHSAVLYAHNQLLRTYSRRELSRTLSKASAVVCVSDFLANEFSTFMPPRLRHLVHVVKNGVDCSQFRPLARNRSQVEPPLRVVFVGRLIPSKGADVLIDAVGLIGKAPIEVTIIGSHGFDARAPLSPYERALRRRAADLDVEVAFKPFTPRHELASALPQFDVLVAPSRWPEPWGLTIGEGMASGLAVIATTVGGIPEVVGEAGILVPPGEPKALAERLMGLLDSPDLLHNAGLSARAHAESHDWNWTWGQLDQVLQKVT